MWNKFLVSVSMVLFFPILSQGIPSLEDEKVVIFFHCNLLNGMGQATIKDILSEEKEKSLRELGSVFYFHFPSESKSKDDKTLTETVFKIRSGVFELKQQFAPSQNLFNFTNNLIFTIQYTDEDYEYLKEKNSKIPSFLLLQEKLPNLYRFYGNTNYISCPDSVSSLGKLSLYLRNAQIIRKNLEYLPLNSYRGDF